MIPTLEQAVLAELSAAGPVPPELRRLAKDRTERALVALRLFSGFPVPWIENLCTGSGRSASVRPLGSFRTRVAEQVARVVQEEHAAGVRVR